MTPRLSFTFSALLHFIFVASLPFPVTDGTVAWDLVQIEYFSSEDEPEAGVTLGISSTAPATGGELGRTLSEIMAAPLAPLIARIEPLVSPIQEAVASTSSIASIPVPQTEFSEITVSRTQGRSNSESSGTADEAGQENIRPGSGSMEGRSAGVPSGNADAVGQGNAGAHSGGGTGRRPGDQGAPSWVTAADYRRNPKPEYPSRAEKFRMEGRVVLLVEVTADGRAQMVVVRTSSGHAMLDDAAVAAVKRWEFRPAERDGVPIAHPVLVPITFRL